MQNRIYPYAVAIIDKLVPTCAGALISNKHILTAGHCISKQEKLPFFNALTVIIGSDKWASESPTCRRPIRLKTAPGYKEIPNERTKNDIGVITVGVSILIVNV